MALFFFFLLLVGGVSYPTNAFPAHTNILRRGFFLCNERLAPDWLSASVIRCECEVSQRALRHQPFYLLVLLLGCFLNYRNSVDGNVFFWYLQVLFNITGALLCVALSVLDHTALLLLLFSPYLAAASPLHVFFLSSFPPFSRIFFFFSFGVGILLFSNVCAKDVTPDS
jgi:hypothetical protein